MFIYLYLPQFLLALSLLLLLVVVGYMASSGRKWIKRQSHNASTIRIRRLAYRRNTVGKYKISGNSSTSERQTDIPLKTPETPGPTNIERMNSRIAV